MRIFAQKTDNGFILYIKHSYIKFAVLQYFSDADLKLINEYFKNNFETANTHCYDRGQINPKRFKLSVSFTSDSEIAYFTLLANTGFEI